MYKKQDRSGCLALNFENKDYQPGPLLDTTPLLESAGSHSLNSNVTATLDRSDVLYRHVSRLPIQKDWPIWARIGLSSPYVWSFWLAVKSLQGSGVLKRAIF